MSVRQCWTCNTEHDIDEACKQSPQARAERAAGGRPGGLFGGRDEATARPVFPASFDGQCSAGDDIFEGELIRADGEGGWIHVECDDE